MEAAPSAEGLGFKWKRWYYITAPRHSYPSDLDPKASLYTKETSRLRAKTLSTSVGDFPKEPNCPNYFGPDVVVKLLLCIVGYDMTI
ncbi:hypothetical protein FCM35_KLT11685 [Carex littledalei]|uniref:Uncharacterized protein n=1 Tax=Carex littledalei TaxID=544730 RepID=A0A833QRI3_9POAL|nr:hypothetical protein FCM35_KLT11685 [Carex littledalei]